MADAAGASQARPICRIQAVQVEGRSQRRGQQRLEMKDDKTYFRCSQQKSQVTFWRPYSVPDGAAWPRGAAADAVGTRDQADVTAASRKRNRGAPLHDDVDVDERRSACDRLARRTCARAPERLRRRRGHQLGGLRMVPHQLGWPNSRRRIRQTGQAAAVMVTGGATVRIECLSVAPGPCRDGGAPTTRK